MNVRPWTLDKYQAVVDIRPLDAMKAAVTTAVTPPSGPCPPSGQRRCSDGSCIARTDLCPDEEMMNQNTILIMVVVALAVVVFLMLLYCFQQRSFRNRNQSRGRSGRLESFIGDNDVFDNASLNLPPPTYDEVINSNLYPPTPVLQRNTRGSSTEEPRTPPPNYDVALTILANSQDTIVPSKTETRTVIRRSVSTDLSSSGIGNNRPSRTSADMEFRRMFSDGR